MWLPGGGGALGAAGGAQGGGVGVEGRAWAGRRAVPGVGATCELADEQGATQPRRPRAGSLVADKWHLLRKNTFNGSTHKKSLRRKTWNSQWPHQCRPHLPPPPRDPPASPALRGRCGSCMRPGSSVVTWPILGVNNCVVNRPLY